MPQRTERRNKPAEHTIIPRRDNVDFKEFAIRSNAKASEDFLRNIRATPADKLTWKPAETNRSVMEICQEVTQSPNWGIQILAHRGWPGGTPEQMQEMMAQMMAERQSWD